MLAFFCNLLYHCTYNQINTMSPENKFMKILIACGVTLEQLKEREWYVTELEPHKYHCTGYHPTLLRIDIIKEKIVIH